MEVLFFLFESLAITLGRFLGRNISELKLKSSNKLVGFLQQQNTKKLTKPMHM